MRAAFAFLLLLAAPAAAEGLSGRYDLYIGGIRAAEVALRAQWDGQGYVAASELRTTGLAEVFYDGFYRVAAAGALGPAGFLPGTFEADSAFGDDRQKVAVTFADARPVAVSATPAFRKRPWEIVPEAQAGVADPLTAALVLLRPGAGGAVCNRSAEVFDGRRRSRVTLGPPERTPDGIVCPALYERVAGFSPKQMRKWTDWALTVRFTDGPEGPRLAAITAPASFGEVVLSRR